MNLHDVNSSCLVKSCFCISLYSVQMWENTDQKNSDTFHAVYSSGKIPNFRSYYYKKRKREGFNYLFIVCKLRQKTYKVSKGAFN